MQGSKLSTVRLVAAVGLTALIGSSSAWGHTVLLDPTPRNGNDGNKDQGTPCGVPGEQRSTNPSVFAPGETIMVMWQETIDHPGHYEIAVSMDGDNDFQTMLGDIADRDEDATRDNPTSYQQQVTLPDQECENCTLRLMQFMSETSTYYKSCADIAIRASAAGDGGVDDGGLGSDGGPNPPSGVGSPPGLCMVAAGGHGSAWSALWLAAVALGLVVARRRR